MSMRALGFCLAILALGCRSESRTEAARQQLLVSPEIPGLHEIALPLDETEAHFGQGVAITEQGALVSAYTLAVGGQRSGGVFPFTRAPGDWPRSMPLAPLVPADDQRFGGVVAAHGHLAAFSSAGSTSPAVALFEYDSGQWSRGVPSFLTPPIGSVEAAFGQALAMTADLLVIGTDAVDETGGGVAYVAERLDHSWGPLLVLPAGDPNVTPGTLYGFSVAAFGDTVVVGAPYAGAAGAVFVFDRGDWSTAYPIWGKQDAGALDGAGFGYSVTLDESLLFVGAPDEALGVGAVYAFERDGSGGWQSRPKIVSRAGSIADGVENDVFGTNLALAFGRLFVAAPGGFPGPIRVSAFGLDPPNDEEARLVPPEGDTGVANFGRWTASNSSTLVVGSEGRAYAYVLEIGAPCANDLHCGSGHCVEQVCCDTACEGGCSSCLADLKGGGSNGQCGAVKAGSNPNDVCGVGATDCGTTGQCDGAGSCAKVRAGVVCGAASCVETTFVGAGRCDGEGTCVAPAPIECEAGYRCLEGSCLVACDESEQCDESYYCHEGACVSGPRCSENRRAAYDAEGNRTACDTILCTDGACPDTCTATEQCVSGVCDRELQRCVDPATLTAAPESSGCSYRARPSPTDSSACALAVLWLLRRRLKRNVTR